MMQRLNCFVNNEHLAATSNINRFAEEKVKFSKEWKLKAQIDIISSFFFLLSFDVFSWQEIVVLTFYFNFMKAKRKKSLLTCQILTPHTFVIPSSAFWSENKSTNVIKVFAHFFGVSTVR